MYYDLRSVALLRNLHLQKLLPTVAKKYSLDVVFMDCETFSHVSCMLYGLSSDYFNRTTWPLVLGKLFLVPMKNVENTWSEGI